MSTTIAKHQKSDFIEIWRGISIILVAAYHFTDRLPHAAMGSDVPPSVVFHSGKLGVYIFFIISAYLIAMTIKSASSLADFYAKRISRIWPLFIVASVTVFIFLQFFTPPSDLTGTKTFAPPELGLADLFGTIFLLEDLGFNWVDGVFWSILVEMKFYLFFGLFAAFFKQNGPKYFAIGALIVGFLEFGVLVFLGNGEHILINRVLHGIFIANFIPFFAIGVLLHQRMYGPLLNANIFLAVIQCIYAIKANPDFEVEGTMQFLFYFTAFLVADSTLLGSAIMRFIGKYSFSIYLFHQMIGLTTIKALTPVIGIDFAILSATGLVIAVAFTGSWIAEWRFRKTSWNFFMWIFTRLGLDKRKLGQEKEETATRLTTGAA